MLKIESTDDNRNRNYLTLRALVLQSLPLVFAILSLTEFGVGGKINEWIRLRYLILIEKKPNKYFLKKNYANLFRRR